MNESQKDQAINISEFNSILISESKNTILGPLS